MQLARFTQVGSVTPILALLLILALLPGWDVLGAAPRAAAGKAGKAAAKEVEEPAPAEGEGEEEEAVEEESPEDKLDAAVELELRYADELTRAGLPDYAKMVLSRFNAAELGPRLEVIKIQGLIAMGKFDDVKKLITARPDSTSADVWAMKLALADGYFAWGKYKEARGLYDLFFKAFPNEPPKALSKFYRDSAYKYAQMLLLMNDKKAAIDAFRFALKANLKKHVRRQILCEMSEEMISVAEQATPDERKKIFAEVDKNLEGVLYGQNDLWFGKAMAMMAHMRVIENDFEGANFLLESSMENLKSLDGALRWEQQKHGVNYIRFSPLAQARYMIGDMMLREAEKIFPPKTAEDKRKLGGLLAGIGEKSRTGALQHFMNVFYQYPSSTWASQAREKGEKVKKMLEDMGAKIDIRITAEQLAAVEKELFQEARTMFNQQQFKEAADSYLHALSMFPETENAVTALGDLARCYIELGLLKEQDEAEKNMQVMYVDMVMRYMAERFNRNKELGVKAGDGVLRVAGKYDELGQRDRRNAMNDIFFTYFTDHPRTAAKLYEEGSEKFTANDFDGALTYFSQIVSNSTPANQMYYPSFSRMAMCHNKKGDTMEEAKTLDAMVKQLQKESAPGHMLVNGLYRLAFCYRSLGTEMMRKGEDEEKKALGERYIRVAIKRFTDIIGMITPPDNPYQKTAEDRENNTKILEGCYFFSGFCFSLLTTPADKVNEYKKQALTQYAKVAADFPKSPFAPAALSQSGTIYVLLQEPDKTREMLDALKKRYPDSDEAKNADFHLGMSLLELGKRDEAIKVFKEMFSGGGAKYTDLQLLTAGNELFKAREYEISLEAFSKVMASPNKGALEELAMLGQGRAMVEVGQEEAGAKVLEALVLKFANSRSVLSASQYLSRAYSQMGAKEPDALKRVDLFNKAITNMKRVRRYDVTSEDWGRSSLAVADIYIQKLEAEKKFGTPESIKDATLKAVLPFLTMIMSADPADAKVAPYVETAYQRVIPLYLLVERWKDAWDKCNEYVKAFPKGRYLADIRKWRGEADTRMTMLGISKDTPKDEDETVVPVEPPPVEAVPKAAPPAAAPAAQPEPEAAQPRVTEPEKAKQEAAVPAAEEKKE